MSRLMISALQSGSGKTVLTCGLLAALKARGCDVRAFKCGPDYIDPMFHSRVLGVPSRNLDLFLQGDAAICHTLAANGGEVSVLEGAMGFYDGIGGTDAASAWQIAVRTQTPVILAVRPKGASLTLAAQIKGLLSFRENSQIAGLLLNDCTPALYAHLAPLLQRETALPVLGYLPPMEQAVLESRHLGLLTADEVEQFAERFAGIAAQLEQTVNLDALLRLARGAAPCTAVSAAEIPPHCCRIAVAQDAAFCFYYQENLEQLQQEGAELCFFSPLCDVALPACCDGLYLGGGYPELYAQQLSQNESLRAEILRAIAAGLPTVAECGGFLYLQKTLQDQKARAYTMVGALPGAGIKTEHLQRFGYLTLSAQEDSLLLRRGECVPAHEFHYWDCTQNGVAFAAHKPMKNALTRCGFATPRLYAAFAHLHFGGALPLARRFVQAAEQYAQSRATAERE